MDLLYTMIIFPLEFIIEWTLEWAFSISDSYGFSLVVVSALVSIGGLPLYHIAEKWQDAERAIQKKMKYKIDEFKSVLKGYELHACLNTLYRQNGYHPIYAVRTSFGILIQIPFFFAAYHLLSNYEVLNGISFLLMDDLGAPDQMLSTPFGSINVLPFLMTIINIGSSFVYGKKGGIRENLQLYGIALFFLVFLYNSPSGLLFYWTLNNLFGLGKNVGYSLIENRSQKTPWIKKQREWFVTLAAKVDLIKPTYWVLIVFAILTLIGHLFLNEKSFNYGSVPEYGYAIQLFSLFVIALFQVTSLFTSSSITIETRVLRVGLSISFVVIFVMGIIAYFTKSKGLELQKAYLFWPFFITGILIAITIVRSVFLKIEKPLLQGISEIDSHRLYWYGAITILFLLLVGAPLGVLDSGSLSDFSNTLFYYIEPLIGLFSVGLFLLILLYITLTESTRKAVGLFFALIAICIVLNHFLFTGDYGDMSNFVFQTKLSIPSIDSVLNGVVCAIAVVIVLTLVYWKKTVIVRKILLICMIAVFGLGIFNAIGFSNKRIGLDHSDKKKLGTLIELSGEGKNVVILMLDRLIGGYIPYAFDMVPEFKEKLKGFAWHPKSISEGTFTITGLPAIVGGYDYRIDSLNSTRTDMPLKKKMDEAFRILPYNFTRAGFKSTLIGPSLMIDKKDKQFIEKTKIKQPIGKYNDLWSQEFGKYIPKEDVHEKLIQFGLFRSVPVAFRKGLYNKGKWLGEHTMKLKRSGVKTDGVTIHPTHGEMRATLNHWSVLEFLPQVTKISKDTTGRFYLMTNNLPHEPWSINADLELDFDGEITFPDSIYAALDSNVLSLKHLYGTVSALKLVSQWIDWLQKKGVYDNTRIIIVSDHGRNVYNPMFNTQKVPLEKGEKRSSLAHFANYELAWFHNGFMVKDFNATGPLTIDSAFRITADVPAIALDGIIDGINPFTQHPIRKEPRMFPYTVGYHDWQMKNQGKYALKMLQHYTLYNDGMFDALNWSGHLKRDDVPSKLGAQGTKVFITNVTRSITEQADFSFTIEANGAYTLEIYVESFYGLEKTRPVLFSHKGKDVVIASDKLFHGVNLVHVDIYDQDKKQIRSFVYDVFKEKKGVFQLPVKKLSGTQGWGSLKVNSSVDGKSLRVGSIDYTQGFGSHTNSRYALALHNSYSTLKFAHGMSGHIGCGDGAEFKLEVDGKLVYRKVSLHEKDIVKGSVSILGADSLVFITKKQKNGKCDHTNWVNPILLKEGAND